MANLSYRNMTENNAMLTSETKYCCSALSDLLYFLLKIQKFPLVGFCAHYLCNGTQMF